ncbi:MAG TPA: DUF1214 domain-containing protein [Verrucomicrobiae bacterium]|nr:DUF1214 domain-containing protein [Verrucomicrobiae bacterium]
MLAALLTGVLATRPVMRVVLERSAIHNGPWSTSLGTGSAGAGFYLRSFVAVAGLYALSRDETVYYTAFTDGSGEPLDGRCDYRLAGRPLPARWWSMTLYGADHYLVPNIAGVYSRHASNLALDADGGYAVPVSAQGQARNWLPAPPVGAFSITLRLYNPAAEVHADPAGIALPSITRMACR